MHSVRQRWILPALLLLPLLILSACSDSTPPAPVEPPKPASLYDRLGGQPAIVAVVDDFVANVAADKRVNRLFRKTDTTKLKARLVEQMCQATGGPCTYTGKSMKDAHKGMGITDAQFNAVVEDLNKSLAKFNVPAQEQADLLAILGPMRADMVVRQPAKAAPKAAAKPAAKKTTAKTTS